jgi:hypothetical protein
LSLDCPGPAHVFRLGRSRAAAPALRVASFAVSIKRGTIDAACRQSQLRWRKGLMIAAAKQADTSDVWTWTAIGTESKLIVSWLLGGRDARAAWESMTDVARRLENRAEPYD